MEGAIITPTGLSTLVVLVAFLLVVTSAALIAQTIMEWRVLQEVREVKHDLEMHDRLAAATPADPSRSP